MSSSRLMIYIAGLVRMEMMKMDYKSVYATKLQIFIGSEDKKDTPHEPWKYEVQTLMKEGAYSAHVVTISAMKSLRGETANIARRLGYDTTIDDLIKMFDGIYGDVEYSNVLPSQFYSAMQLLDETVSA